MNWSTIFKAFKNKSLRRKILAVVGIIVVYRLLAHVPVPLAEPTKFKEVIDSVINNNNFGGFINLISGGALTSLSIVLIGLGPFINASIITQLMTKAVPKLEEMHKDGEAGRRKIQQWTRILAVPLAILQSIAYIYILRQTVVDPNTTSFIDSSFSEWFMAVLAMTTGSILLMWLGELITEQGIGNGISTVIFISIISQLPTTVAGLGASLFDTSVSGGTNVFGLFTLPMNPTVLAITAGLIVGLVIVLYFLVKVNEAQRIITINHAKRIHGNTSYGGIKSILPIKMIAAGVIPVIFAVAFLSLPAFVGQLLKSADKAPEFANTLITVFQSPSPGQFTGSTWQAFIYPALYFLLVVGFTYFYTSVVFNSKEISEGLQKQGGFIEGVRPGVQTEKYLNTVVNRLNLFGAVSLGVIALLPFIADFLMYNLAGIQTQLAISGTGLLIVVTVAIESLRQLSSRAIMTTYDEYQ